MSAIRTLLSCALFMGASAAAAEEDYLSYGPRPAYLISKMAEGPLRDKLQSCLSQTPSRSLFSIGHRGAPLQFPEHTVASNRAAAQMGAGILECDVTFTADQELVCRHAQNDLHTTTNIVTTALGDKCTAPFTPAAGGVAASAECRTSDLTLTEFKTLQPKMDASDKTATTPAAYLGGIAGFRTDLYTQDAGLMTHAESIQLFRALGAKFTPELKSPSVEMPFNGFTQEAYAQKMIDEYKAAGVPAADVWAQSFNLDDILYWINNEPEFGAQAVYLDDRYEVPEGNGGLIDPMNATTFQPSMPELADMGVKYVAPPLWMLVTLDAAGKIVPSTYAIEAKAAGLNIITWSLERAGPLHAGGGWYFQSIKEAVTNDGAMYELVDVLAQDVGVKGIFSDWPATVTYYANCMGL
ncbi:MAG: glycerophosphoryl diester phosphodiesterase [Pseudorhodobacter sp.]|jgi:glycerophosphoryl diester phosphodiesterase